MDYEPPTLPSASEVDHPQERQTDVDEDVDVGQDALEGQVPTVDCVPGAEARPWANYMAYSNERINVKLRYKWDGKDASLDLKVKRGMRLTALIEKLATGRACPWTKWNAPKCHHLVHKGTLLDNKRVIGDYSVEPEVLLDMVFSAEEAEALVKAGKGQFDDYRPPHKDMLDDKIKQWDAQGTARRRSTCEFVNVNTVSGFGGTMSGTQALQQPGGTVRRTSVVTLVLEGGQTTMAPIATSSTLTLRQEGESMPPLPARRPSQSTAAAPVEQPKTLERVKVIVEFSNTTSGLAYSHEHVLTRGSKFDDVVASIKAKSFHSSYNDKCVILYKGVVVEPRRSIGDYVASDKVMRCVVARDAEQAEKLRQQTAEEGYRPPYEALIEERRKAREASVQQAADKMRADLPSPRESRSNSTVTITVTTVPLNPEGTGVRRPSVGQEQGTRRPSVGQAAVAGARRRSSGGQGLRPSKGTAVSVVQEEQGPEGGKGEATHLPPIAF